MTATTMPRWLAEVLRRPFRSLAPVALLALLPKCAVCVLAYAGLGAALGLRAQRICGATAGPVAWWVPSLALFAVSLGFLGYRTRGRHD
jgi:hypothetical protein